MKRIAVLCLLLPLFGCASMRLRHSTPIERKAYNTFVAAKAFLDAEKKQHPECATDPVSKICSGLARATAAKDTLIDAALVYCASPQFDQGGVCTPPQKGTPAYEQSLAKLKASLQIYDRAEADLKGALK